MPTPIFRSAEDSLDAAAATEATEFLKELRGVTPNQPGDAFKQGEKILVNKPRKVRDTSISPVTEYVRSLDGDYKTTQEVADELGVSAQLIRKWSRNPRPTQAPSFIAPFGKIKINLYTPEDIQSLRDYMSNRKQVFRRDDYPE